MRILFNNVLVKPDPNDRIMLTNGTELFFDSRFEEQKAAPQSGTVVLLPEKLRFSMDMGQPSLLYQTDMELQVGDRVIFNFNAHEYATKNGMMINGSILVSYDQIYVAIRDGKVICINGSVIVDPVEEKVPETKLIVPELAKGKKMKTMGRVLYASEKPHYKSRLLPNVDTMACPMVVLPGGGFEDLGRYVAPGDLVRFHYSNAIPLQHYHEINGAVSKKLLYRMQHNDIEIVLEASENSLT